MDFTTNINKLYNDFFKEENFKNIDLPFINNAKNKKFKELIDPKYRESQRMKNFLKYKKGKEQTFSKYLAFECKNINRNIKHIQKIISKAIKEIKKTAGD